MPLKSLQLPALQALVSPGLSCSLSLLQRLWSTWLSRHVLDPAVASPSTWMVMAKPSRQIVLHYIAKVQLTD